jgi:hypothetical protein
MSVMSTDRYLPTGRCSGCNEETHLPSFGDGMCFLCATDGPPGEWSPTGRATVGERATYDFLTEAEEERLADVQDIFAEAQAIHWPAIRLDAISAQRFNRSVRARSKIREGLTSYEQRELDKREERRRLKRRQIRLHREAVKLVRDKRLERERQSERASGRHQRQVATYEENKRRRNGAGYYANAEKILQAQTLRVAGWSLRAIAKKTGMHKDTVRLHVRWVGRHEAMVLTHQRWKEEGRPVLPPWRRACVRGDDGSSHEREP